MLFLGLQFLRLEGFEKRLFVGNGNQNDHFAVHAVLANRAVSAHRFLGVDAVQPLLAEQRLVEAFDLLEIFSLVGEFRARKADLRLWDGSVPLRILRLNTNSPFEPGVSCGDTRVA